MAAALDLAGLKSAHFDALEKVLKKLSGDVDGRLMRPLVRRGFAAAKGDNVWVLTALGKKALEAR